jgi:hypothetical protein
MVLRGGFGIAYNRVPTILFANTRGNPPFFARYRICCGTSAQDFSTPFNNGQILYALGANNTPFSFPVNPALISPINPATGIPTLANGAQLEIYGAPSDVPTPYVYTYSLESQYDLPGNFTAEVGYQGSASRKLVRLVNQRFLYTDPNIFSGVFFPTPDTTASYNAMIARTAGPRVSTSPLTTAPARARTRPSRSTCGRSAALPTTTCATTSSRRAYGNCPS